MKLYILIATTVALSLLSALAASLFICVSFLEPTVATTEVPGIARGYSALAQLPLTAIVFMLGAWVLGTGVILTCVWLLVLQPIQHLSTFMRTISAASNLTLRLPIRGSTVVGSLASSVNAILDTTEASYLDMLQARCEAEHANKGKSLFIAKVSHELRTPIHAITGMLRILLKQEHAPGKRQYIQMAQDSATALLGTINEILDFSKMQNGELSLENEPFTLSESVRATIEQLIPRFEEKPDVQLSWDLHPDLPEAVVGDAARLKNILMNLLGNSFKFTERGVVTLEIKPITIRGETLSPGVRIRVQDTGIGIPEDKLRHIFNPFTTAHERTARLYAGTGLGLAIVKQIVEHIGGSVEVKSREGEGTCFTVDLPLSEATAGATRHTNQLGQGKKVAVLGACNHRRAVVERGLSRFGCAVTTFDVESSTGIRALMDDIASYDLLHIVKDREVLLDEIRPLLVQASRANTTVILSVLSSELASTEHMVSSENFFETVQPTCALDILLMSSGQLAPTTSLGAYEEQQEHVRHKLRILIADDAKTNQIILKNLLEDAGHHVEVVENGKQLLDTILVRHSHPAVDQVGFDLVLTDIQMPVMDGLTAARNFRAIEKQAANPKKLPIVAVTSYALPEECSRMLASGIDHIITKPISPRRLSRLLSQISCEVEVEKSEGEQEKSQHEIVEELCRIAHSVGERVSAITEEVLSVYAVPGEALIDVQDIYERSGNSLRRTELIINGFLECYSEPLQALNATTVPVADPKTFRRVVHSLKGILLDVGAKHAAELAGCLEKASVETPASVTLEQIHDLHGAIARTVLVLQELVAALPSVEAVSALPPIEGELCLH